MKLALDGRGRPGAAAHAKANQQTIPMKSTAHLFLPILAAVMHVGAAHALCLDPKSGISGYKLPLQSEIQSADAIVVGRVLAENGMQEDRNDPDGVTAYDVTIKVQAILKGKLPNVFSVWNENTSARYPMSVGEEHVLFISQGRDGQFFVDSCGNSSLTSKRNDFVKQIRAELKK